MNGYLLDTNVLVWILRGTRPQIVSRVKAQPVDRLHISSLTLHELYFGAYRSQNVHRALSAIDGFAFDVVDFDRDDARCAGEIRARLASVGQGIGAIDLLIAGQALARELVLVTHNLREFSRIPELKLEDWEE